MLLGHTDVGCDLAPRLNGRLGGGLAMDCLALSVDPATKLLVPIRPVFGGNAHAFGGLTKQKICDKFGIA